MAWTQTVTVTSTPELTNALPNAFWTKALGSDATGFYLLRESGPVSQQVTIIEKYTYAGALVYSRDIPGTTGVMGNSSMHRKTEMSNGKIYLFFEGWDKAKGQNSFSVKTIGEDGTLGTDEIVLETEPAPGQMKSADYSISFSPDGSKLVVLTEKPFVKGGKEELRLQTFSTTDFQSLWKQDLVLDNESEKYPNNDVIADDAGNAYIYKDIKITNKEHIYQLITAGKDGSKTERIDLKLYYPTHHKMKIGSDGKLVIAGMLAEQGSHISNWQAVWYLKADADGSILINRTEPLGADMLRMLLPEKQAIAEGAKLSDFVLKDVLIKPSGGILLLAEEQRSTNTAIGQSGPPVYEYNLTYGGVLVLSFDADGMRDWNTLVDKRQMERTLDPKLHFGSFAYQLKDNQLYLVWNYTDLRTDAPVHTFRYWVDKSGAKINIDNLFGKEALYPTLLSVINADGSLQYTERSFSALPLEAIQQPNAFPMAVDPTFFFPTSKGMVILSHMPGPQAKRYKFNTIAY